MDARCCINLFGELRVTFGDGREPLTRFRTQKAAALLAYLALFPRQTAGRELLLELFWSDKDAATGRDNLSTTLSVLRRQLEPPGSGAGGLLIADRQTIRLHPAAFTTDVRRFEECLTEGVRATDSRVKAALLGEAVSHYAGELLPGFYDDWILREQGRLAGRFADALEEWGSALERIGDRSGAVSAYRRCVAADPLREEAYRALMRLLCGLEGPAAAKTVFQELTSYLRRELDTTPSPATRRLLEQIEREPEAFASNASPPLHPGSGTGDREKEAVVLPRVAATPPPLAATSVHLPLYLTRLIGREQECDRLVELLAGDAPSRLVTVLGAGGAGKTRLATEAAARVAGSFAGGVWFVSLADIPGPAFLPVALASALGLPPDGNADPLERVADFLNGIGSPILLVFDNFEHLLAPRYEAEGAKAENPMLRGAGAFIRLLLSRVDLLSCVVTSRQVLGLGGEWAFPLGPLGVPEEGALELGELSRNPAVALFVERARAVQPDFALTVTNAEAVTAVCRLMEGIPLAVEMAAAWIKTLPPVRMREQLERRLLGLASRRRDLPARHQSLNAAAEWSYQLLEQDHQALFRRLSVFRAGWTGAQAEALFGDDVFLLLADLQERSLVVTVGEERYRLLEPLREFGSAKMWEIGEAEEWRQRHAAFFQRLVWETGPELDGSEQKTHLEKLTDSHDNIRIALEYYLEKERTAAEQEDGLKMCSALFRFWSIRGHIREGRTWCRRMLAAASDLPLTRARASVSNAAGHLASLQGDYDEAQARFEEARDVWEAVGQRSGVGVALGGLGNLALARAAPVAARAYHEQALLIHRELDKTHGIAITLGNIARCIVAGGGNLAEAKAMHEEALAIHRRLGNQVSVAITLGSLAATLCAMQEPDAARLYLAEALTINRSLQNPEGEAYNHCGLGQIELGEKAYDAARTHLIEALRIWLRSGNRAGSATALESLADLAVKQAAGERAARLYGAADTIRADAGGIPRPISEEAEYACAVAQARAILGSARFDAVRESGRGLTPDQVFALVTA